MINLTIDGQDVKTNGTFAYDGCHKIYIIEDDVDTKEAQKMGYSILSIEKLSEAYYGSCGLQFISNWKLTERYVPQCPEEEPDIIVWEN